MNTPEGHTQACTTERSATSPAPCTPRLLTAPRAPANQEFLSVIVLAPPAFYATALTWLGATFARIAPVELHPRPVEASPLLENR